MSKALTQSFETSGAAETVASSQVAVTASEKGAASGVATLDGSSTLTAAQIPAAVELVARKGAASGYCQLDSGVLVPLSVLREFTGASFGGAGAAGQVPAPAAAKHRGVLRGDKTWTDQSSGDVSITRVVDDQSTPAIAGLQVKELQADGGYSVVTVSRASSTSENQHVIQSASAGTRRARYGTRATGGTPDPFVDLQLEPTPFATGVSQPGPVGRATVWGDPVALTHKFWRRCVARELGTTFDTFGMPAPTITTPGAAEAEYDADGYSYVALQYDTPSGFPGGSACSLVWSGTLTRRRLNPEAWIFADFFPTNGRIFMGWCSENPCGLVYDGTNTDFASVITPSYTRSDFSFDATAKTITTAGGDFVAAGFVVGMAINIAGANGANNTGIKRLNTVTTTVLTVDESLTTNSDAVSVTISRRLVVAGLWWDSVEHVGSDFFRAITCSGTAQTEVVTAIQPSLAAANPGVYTIRHYAAGDTWYFGRWDYDLGTIADWTETDTNGPAAAFKLGAAIEQRHISDSTKRQMRVRQFCYR